MAPDNPVWVELCVLASEVDARLIQGRLETEGIPCEIESMKFHAEPVNLGLMSEVRLHVLERDLERARVLLQEVDEDDLF